MTRRPRDRVAGGLETLVDGPRIALVLNESGANALEIAERRKELQRARQQAFTPKQLEQPPGAGSEKALADRRDHDCAGVDQ